MARQPLANQRIGLFGKGGSGKSTLTVFLSEALRELDYPVLVLDADSTNAGLAAALGIGSPPSPLLEHFGGMVFAGGRVTCPVDDPTPLPDAGLELRALPAQYVGRSPTGVTLLVAGKIGGLGPGAGCDGPVAKIARDARATDLPGHVTLADFKAGFEDSARGVLASLDGALVVVDPTSAAVQMAQDFVSTFEQMQRGALPATSHLEDTALVEIALRLYRSSRLRWVAAVLNQVDEPSEERFLRSRLEDLRVPVLGAIPEDRRVREQWLHGRPLRSPALARAATALASRLEELAVATASGAPAETATAEPIGAASGGRP